MKLQDFSDLASAQEYTEYGQRLVSPDMMVAMLTATGNMAAVMNATTNEAYGVQAALRFGSEFNFMEDRTDPDNPVAHDLSITHLMQKMVDENIITQTLMDTAIEYANPSTKPFENASQEEFDAAKADGETNATSVLYESQDVVHLVTAGKKLLKFKVTLDAPATYDSVVTISATGKQTTDETVYLPLSRTFTVNVKAGQQGVFSLDQAIAYFPRHVQFTAVIDKANTPFILDVVTS